MKNLFKKLEEKRGLIKMELTKDEAMKIERIESMSGVDVLDHDSIENWKNAALAIVETETLCELSKDMDAPESARAMADAELKRRFDKAFPEIKNTLLDAIPFESLYELSKSEDTPEGAKKMATAEMQRRIENATAIQ